MSTPRNDMFLAFIRVPVPIGTAGAFIWGVATFVQRWDPIAFPDLEKVFELLWMQIYSGLVLSALVAFYLYWSSRAFRLAWLHWRVRLAARINVPPPGMVLVPAGHFRFGLAGSKTYLETFFIDKYPVTNERYFEFVQATSYPPPPSWSNGTPPENKMLHPVTCVNLPDIRQYCKWRSACENRRIALPTEEEWEKAARGPFGYSYPWGNQFNPELCNVGKGPDGTTSKVIEYPGGVSPYGCYDMCGDVWEWTGTSFSEKEGVIVLKGGSFYFDEGFSLLWIRYHDPSSDRWPDLGFRCVSRL